MKVVESVGERCFAWKGESSFGMWEVKQIKMYFFFFFGAISVEVGKHGGEGAVEPDFFIYLGALCWYPTSPHQLGGYFKFWTHQGRQLDGSAQDFRKSIILNSKGFTYSSICIIKILDSFGISLILSILLSN